LLIQDRYRALRIIGQGGFGKTFLAQDEGKPSKPKCVIKQFIYDDPATLREAQRLFEQEAVRLDDLGRHPQIPELLAHCEQEGRQYLVQEFIDGENLLQELNRAGRFSEAKIKDLLLDLLPVLQFIHAGQVIHRDIKPENIIRRRSDGRLVVVDFGAAKMASKTALAKTGTTIGSAEYTAPEQARGKAVFASDIYGLGVTCIYLLTQISPFDLYSDHEDAWVWRQFLNGNPVSNELGAVIDRMLAKALARRYQTSTEILQVLQPAINSHPNPTKVQSPSKPNPQIIIPQPVSQNPRPEQFQAQLQVLEFEFEYVKTRLVTESRFLGLGTKTKVELDRKRGKAQYIRENIGNGVTIDLVRIPAGKFMMGGNLYDSQKPIHEVTLQEFWMGKYAVTQKQWQAVMGTNPANFKGENLPVEIVTWHDAMDFCEKVSRKIGKKLRLPTEAEWEYACRAGTNTAFHCGETITTDLVNFNGNYNYPYGPKGQYRQKTVDVDSFYPNQWGLYQMQGNVREWCEDVWHENYNGAPTDGSAWLTGGDQDRRAERGGSWHIGSDYCLSAHRDWYYRNFSGNNDSGFRVVV
jgi:formylglycine-generating enzyme required for sulfatase activity